MPPGKLNFLALLGLALCVMEGFAKKKSSSDFGGDFTSSSVSGSAAPGPTSASMGGKAASAMAIGTGDSGPGNYASNFKTPNYTQYTSQNFKDFLPNYESMMEKSLDSGKASSGASSFSNFSSVNTLLKGFMKLQKEQLEMDKAKAEAKKAKVDLAMDYDESDDILDNEDSKRRKRSAFDSTVNLAKERLMEMILRNKTVLEQLTNILESKAKMGGPASALEPLPKLGVDVKPDYKYKAHVKPWASKVTLGGLKAKASSRRKNLLKIAHEMMAKMHKKKRPVAISHPWGGTMKYTPKLARSFDRRDNQSPPPPPPPDASTPPPSAFWANLGSKASTWFKNSPGGAPGAAPAPPGQGSPAPWGSPPPPPPPSQGGAGWGGAAPDQGAPSPPPPQGGAGQGMSWGAPPPPPPQGSSGSPKPQDGGAAFGGAGAQSSQQRKRALMSSMNVPIPMHGAVALSPDPIEDMDADMEDMYPPPRLPSRLPSPPLAFPMNENQKNIPDLSFNFDNMFPGSGKSPSPGGASKKPADGPMSFSMGSPTSKPLTRPKMSKGTFYTGSGALPVVEYTNDLQPMYIIPARPLPISKRPSYKKIIMQKPVAMPSLSPQTPIYEIIPEGYQVEGLGAGYKTTLVRSGRKIPKEDKMATAKPIILSKVGKNENKKVIVDPASGMILVHDEESPIRIKRSTNDTAEDETVKANLTDADPNGHSHGVNGKDKVDGKGVKTHPYPWKLYVRDLIQYQADGDNTDYDYDSVEKDDEETEQGEEKQENGPQTRLSRRRVKINFSQKAKLPAGTVETISAGGGRAPGHHEGGGITVKVNKDDEDAKEEDVTKVDLRAQKEQRKTLNFFFTW